ncbi:SGNH/GDSL hydrolase family protein [Calothrix sp. PCC 6303]|uniref:SGNH/GDSL hydrolase family protein n=1 Tax=Calothrix sp. PCC 6303 TaxID=1170562 RepID=UPI0002A056D6|nr:GDSL-type esterase/lipase family protein [Calothrix sp. PCC 6303]AFY99269.1 lipolytic protein G-D-S-L family [Calothrix sp. PCC 6303]
MKLRKLNVILSALVLTILGSSIFLNFVLYNQAKKYYLEVNQVRLDPLGLTYHPINSSEATNTRSLRVVFFGDSRAFGWISPNVKEYEFINRGISSQTSVQSLERFSSHVSSLKPNLVVIQIGINDLKNVALFPDRRDTIIRNCKANIRRIVEDSKNLGATVIVTTIFPVGEVPLQRKPFWSDDVGKAVKEVNTYIATLADNKTIVFDTFPILADNQGMVLEKYRSDELHLNQQGYMAINSKFVELLNAIALK